MRLRQRDKLQRSYLLQWYWIDPMSFCGAFQVWLGFMLKGVTLSALHRGMHGGCNAVASFVPYDLKHVSLHLIRQNKKKNQINIKSKSIFACKSLLPSLRKPPNNLDRILKAMCDCGCQGNESYPKDELFNSFKGNEKKTSKMQEYNQQIYSRLSRIRPSYSSARNITQFRQKKNHQNKKQQTKTKEEPELWQDKQ